MFTNNPYRLWQWPAQMELPLCYWATNPAHDTLLAILVEGVQHE